MAKALWESLKEEVGDFPLILMGHGTEHAADASYAMMEQSLRAYAKHEIYIATVEGSITIEDVIARMKSGLQSRQNGKVLLTPFMLVAETMQIMIWQAACRTGSSRMRIPLPENYRRRDTGRNV